jgi:hypothetical protein
MTKYQTLCEFIAELGGLRAFRSQMDTIGASDLRAIGADNWHKAKPFRKKLVRLETGLTPDDTTLAAWNAGYFPQFSERPEVQDLIDAIDSELAGKPVYTLDDAHAIFEEEMAAYEREQTMAALHELADIEPELDAVAFESVPFIDVPSRAIPKDSELITGANGEAVYLYYQIYINKKGNEGRTYYAKAFRAGEKIHEWHNAFSSHEARMDKVNEFFASSLELA